MVELDGLYFALILLACIERFKRVEPDSLLLSRTFRGWKVERPCLYPGNGDWGWFWIGLNPMLGPTLLLQRRYSNQSIAARGNSQPEHVTLEMF